MKIIGLDPGGTTGIAVYQHDFHDQDSCGFFDRFQLGPDPHHLELYNFLMGKNPDLIVCERFDYRPKLGHADLDPVEYIGVVKLYDQFRKYDKSDFQVHFQQQLAHDKGLWTDDKLKVLDLHIPGEPHANDATRQVLYYVTNHMNELCWIELYGRMK